MPASFFHIIDRVDEEARIDRQRTFRRSFQFGTDPGSKIRSVDPGTQKPGVKPVGPSQVPAVLDRCFRAIDADDHPPLRSEVDSIPARPAAEVKHPAVLGRLTQDEKRELGGGSKAGSLCSVEIVPVIASRGLCCPHRPDLSLQLVLCLVPVLQGVYSATVTRMKSRVQQVHCTAETRDDFMAQSPAQYQGCRAGRSTS
jgi:hypothetical protein